MPKIAFVNGQYLPLHQAGVSVEDRGFQFADGVYEVILVTAGKLFDLEPHLERLERSCQELQLAMPTSTLALKFIIRQVVQRNRVRQGLVYLQITRGAARRDFPFPKDTKPTLVVMARSQPSPSAAMLENGVSVITVPDQRWARRDIKSVALLPAALAKQQAKQARAFEAWQVTNNDEISEGSSTNAFIIKNKQLMTHPATHTILNGVTRMRLLRLAAEQGLKIVERPFTVTEAKQADEAFVSSTTTYLVPVVKIDDATVGTGRPGPQTMELRSRYVADIKAFLEQEQGARLAV